MESFFLTPNLPDRAVKKLVMGFEAAPLLAPILMEYGIDTIVCPPNPEVDERLAGHADLSLLHLGGKRFILAKHFQNTSFFESLRAMGADVQFAENGQGRAYPKDASLCALFVGERCFHNRRVSDSALLNATEVINTAQGYAKCAVCPVDERSAVTSDHGMARALKEQGIDVLELGAGQVLLTGFDEGFIGGAAFKLSPTLLAVTGQLPSKAESGRLEKFLKARGIEPVYLTNFPAFDIGSAIPIC